MSIYFEAEFDSAISYSKIYRVVMTYANKN